MFPENDTYEEVKISKVTINEDEEGTIEGYTLLREDAWSMYVSADSFEDELFIPEAGMLARFYGEGIGRPVRGIFLNGKKIYYRTKEEEKEKHLVDTYGANVEDWLARWDADKTVWSVELGGLGPSYEQAIQITVAELVRIQINKAYNHTNWDDKTKWQKDRDDIETTAFTVPAIEKLGLSGSQFGAAMNMSTRLYSQGPIKLLSNPEVKDRLIMVQKYFPS